MKNIISLSQNFENKDITNILNKTIPIGNQLSKFELNKQNIISKDETIRLIKYKNLTSNSENNKDILNDLYFEKINSVFTLFINCNNGRITDDVKNTFYMLIFLFKKDFEKIIIVIVSKNHDLETYSDEEDDFEYDDIKDIKKNSIREIDISIRRETDTVVYLGLLENIINRFLKSEKNKELKIEKINVPTTIIYYNDNPDIEKKSIEYLWMLINNRFSGNRELLIHPAFSSYGVPKFLFPNEEHPIQPDFKFVHS